MDFSNSQKLLSDKMSQLGGVKFLNADYHPLTVKELDELSSQLDVQLPEIYRWFSSVFGGGMPQKWLEFPLLELAHWDPTPTRNISLFAGGGTGNGSVFKLIRLFRSRFPDSLVPIAKAPSGDLIFIGGSGVDLGKIFFWDHEHEWDPEDYPGGETPPREVIFQNIVLVANSLEDFIMSMVAKDI